LSRAELLADDAAFGAFDKSEELGNLRVGLEVFVKIRGGFGEVEILFEEDFFVSATECTDTAELMDGGEARDDGVVLDMDVAGEGGIIREDDVVADLAIVCDVAVSEEEIVRADTCG